MKCALLKVKPIRVKDLEWGHELKFLMLQFRVLRSFQGKKNIVNKSQASIIIRFWVLLWNAWRRNVASIPHTTKNFIWLCWEDMKFDAQTINKYD